MFMVVGLSMVRRKEWLFEEPLLQGDNSQGDENVGHPALFDGGDRTVATEMVIGFLHPFLRLERPHQLVEVGDDVEGLQRERRGRDRISDRGHSRVSTRARQKAIERAMPINNGATSGGIKVQLRRSR